MRCTPPIAKAFFTRKRGSILLAGALLAVPLFVQAQSVSVTTPPVGYVKTTLLAASDTFIAPTLTRPPEYIGTVESATAATIGVSGDPQWAVGAFTYEQGVQPNTYYARLGAAPEGETNPFEGRTFKIEGGVGNVVSVTDPLSGNLSTVPVGTKIEIIPYWTLNTLFPASNAGVTFEASTSALATGRKTVVIKPNTTSVGVNLSSSNMFYFLGGATNQWRKIGGGSVNFGDTIIEPQVPISMRNNNSGAVDRIFFLQGNVALGKSSTLVKGNFSGAQDNALNIPFPVSTTLSDLGLITSGAFQVSINALPTGRRDTLSVYSNDVSEINKSPVATYYYIAGTTNQWRKVGGGSVNCNADLVSPNTQIVLRKFTNGVDYTFVWQSETL